MYIVEAGGFWKGSMTMIKELSVFIDVLKGFSTLIIASS